MSYTPINWQTGDTITAEKLNKMDNGWSVSSTQLFSETVTTVSGEYGNEGELSYSGQVNAAEIVVTFSGTDYTCPVVTMNSGTGYGGVDSEWNYDFTDFPFALVFSPGGNFLATETAGTYAISVNTKSIELSSDFQEAVSSASGVFIAVENITTWQEIYDALADGKDVRINGVLEDGVYSEPVYSAAFDGDYYNVTSFNINGGFAEARYYIANSANSVIVPN